MFSILDTPETTTLAEARRAVNEGLLNEDDFIQWFQSYVPSAPKPRLLGRRHKRIRRPGQTVMSRLFGIDNSSEG